MTTLVEWYGKLTDEQKTHLIEYNWFDPEKPYGVKHWGLDDVNVDELITDYGYHRSSENTRLKALLLLSTNKDGDFCHWNDKISYTERQEYMYRLFCQRYDCSGLDEAIFYCDSDYVKKCLDKCFNSESYRRSGTENLFLRIFATTEDFDNIDWVTCVNACSIHTLASWVIPMIPQDQLYNICKEKETIIEWAEYNPDDDVFDRLFFCDEDGWTDEQKRNVIRSYNNLVDTYHAQDPEKMFYRFDNFLRRFVTVNKRYLSVFSRFNSSVCNKIYCARKSYLTGNETAKQELRYGDEIRRLAMISASCSQNRVYAGRGNSMKELAGLLPLYKFNFRDIFDSIYPDNPEFPCVFDNIQRG